MSNHMKYLGTAISSDRNIVEEVQTRMSKENRTSSYLKDII